MKRFAAGRAILSLLTVAALLFGLMGTAFANTGTPGWQEPTKPGWKDGEAQRGWIQSKIEHMTLEEKVGQMFMPYGYGTSAGDTTYAVSNQKVLGTDTMAQAAEQYHLGGLIYFNWNYNINLPMDPAQVATLSNDLQTAAMGQRLPIPLLIATDQEMGVVVRADYPATQFPGNMALGAARDPKYAETAATITGQELRALGINMNLAPVLDVNINPDNPVIGVRSFGGDPQLVSSLGVAAVGAYQQNVIATAKHFPGHGDTATDSHVGLPLITHTREQLDTIDLVPFKAAVDAGIDAVMTAHILVPALDDSGLPATFSKPILTDLLKGEMGFRGIVITDALTMAGAKVFQTEEEMPVKAILAGVDLILMPEHLPLQYNAVLNAVKDGTIPMERIDDAVYRILRVKMKQGLFNDSFTTLEAAQAIGSPENMAQADLVADKTITLLRNDAGLLPLTANGQKVLVTGYGLTTTASLAGYLNERGLTATVYQTGTSPGANVIANAVAKAADADLIIVSTYNMRPTSSQVNLVDALLATGKPVITVAVRNPYDLAVLPGVQTSLATYSYRPVSLKALVRVLFGDVNPSGLLPVAIPGLYDYGYGLHY